MVNQNPLVAACFQTKMAIVSEDRKRENVPAN